MGDVYGGAELRQATAGEPRAGTSSVKPGPLRPSAPVGCRPDVRLSLSNSRRAGSQTKREGKKTAGGAASEPRLLAPQPLEAAADGDRPHRHGLAALAVPELLGPLDPLERQPQLRGDAADDEERPAAEGVGLVE